MTEKRVRVKEPIPMTPAQVLTIDDYVRNCVPALHQLGTARALKGQMGKALALKQKCLQCAGYQRKEVELCPVITCALHPVRPYQHDGTDDNTDV